MAALFFSSIVTVSPITRGFLRWVRQLARFSEFIPGLPLFSLPGVGINPDTELFVCPMTMRRRRRSVMLAVTRCQLINTMPPLIVMMASAL